MGKVYIYDKQTKTEFWGFIDKQPSETMVEDDSGFTYTKTFEMNLLYHYPLGHILSEFISIDENKLINTAKEVENTFGQPSAYYAELLNFPIMDDFYDYEDSQEALIKLANYIAFFRQFIDLCHINTVIFSNIGLDALMNIFDPDVVDLLPRVEAIIDFPPSVGLNRWEESKCYLKPCDELEERLNFLSPNPSENAGKMLKLLEEEIGYTVFSNDDEHSYYAAECYREIFDCFFKTIRNLIDENVLINKCPNCEKYFVPANRSDTVYCDRMAPQDSTKTCKEYGARQTWQKTLRENEAAGLYRKIYMAKQMLTKRNPNDTAYKEAFSWFKTESKKWKVDIKAGIKAEDDYITWLREVKERRVL